MPIITLEVMQDSTLSDMVLDESFYNETQQNNSVETDTKEPIGYLTEKNEEPNENEGAKDDSDSAEALRVRNDLLEYTTGSNGSVTCKLCGKVLASRPHWYRHKYRAHVMNNGSPTTAPLFQCEQCFIYFKSRKGYIGHIASRHSETLQDASPVLTNEQAEALAREKEAAAPAQPAVKKEPDPELAIPKTIVPNYQAPPTRPIAAKPEPPGKKALRSREPSGDKEWEAKRTREEKLVADIIARVRRECEAQGPGPARRGYSRKSAAMRT